MSPVGFLLLASVPMKIGSVWSWIAREFRQLVCLAGAWSAWTYPPPWPATEAKTRQSSRIVKVEFAFTVQVWCVGPQNTRGAPSQGTAGPPGT